MKRLILLLIIAAALLVGQVIVNCSRPLDTNSFTPDPNPDPNKRDTVYIYDTSYLFDTIVTVDTIFAEDTTFIYDTIFNGDTTIIIDTIISYDTIFAGDTIILVDTLLNYDTVFINDTIYDTVFDTFVDTVTETDTVIIVDTLLVSPTYCASLSCNQKKIVWMLQNHTGLYRLEFSASGDDGDPKDKLVVEIDGEKFYWKPYENPDMILSLDLDAGAKVLIYSCTPHAYGHTLDICLKIEEL